MEISNFWERYLDLINDFKVGKVKHNKFGNFYYRNMEQIYETLKPLEQQYKIFFQTTNETKVILDTKNVETTLSVIDTLANKVMFTTTSTIELQPRDENVKMNESQLGGSAESYALKRVYQNALQIDDTRDSDDPELTPMQPVRKGFTPQPQPQAPQEQEPTATDKPIKPIRKVVTVSQETPQEQEPQSDNDKLYEITRKSLNAKTPEAINELIDEALSIKDDEKTIKVLNGKAISLGFVKNIKTNKWEERK